MGKYGLYHPFGALTVELRQTLERLCKEHIAAVASGSKDADRIMNSWRSNFANAIEGATSVSALEEVRALGSPTAVLTAKLGRKLEALRKTEAREASKALPA